MIDLATGQEMKLKNVIQIGTPGEEEKVYIEEAAYGRIHLDDFHERRIFVLMGHTACEDGLYETYVDAAIPVWDIEFDRQTPLWTNRIWNEVYREIKQDYESDIIVGWVYDCKGCIPKITPELEAIHREYFGGVHQLLLLTDTVSGEEIFYRSRSNHLYPKEGFYVYSGTKKQVIKPQIEIEIPKVMLRSRESRTETGQDTAASPSRPRGQYRELMQKQQRKGKASRRTEPIPQGRTGGFAAAVAVALLLGIIGTAIYKNPEQFARVTDWVETFSTRAIRFTTEQEEKASEKEQAAQEVVPIETIDGEIPSRPEQTQDGGESTAPAAGQ